MRSKLSRGAALLAVCAALAPAAPAGAATYAVSGKQIAVNENAGIFKMRGGLIGRWNVTSFKELAKSPLYRAKGTERFKGCLDRRRDRSCAGDPSGTLSFRFLYWARFASSDPASLVWGACWHPIVSGTGAFASARGVITMVDTPTGHGVSTSYIGNVTLPGRRAGGAAAHRPARAAAAGRTGCGAAR
jgi:hypothetical protein